MGPKRQKKLIVILGPTSSGKSELAVRIAKKFKGEIVSADSRQAYKEMNIGTGKITKKEMRDIPHYLLDIASPKRKFSVVRYRKLALKAINKIHQKGKIPILCGGSAFYIQAIIEGIVIPEVKPDWQLRKKLERKSAEELYKMLKNYDPRRAKTIERKNKRRLIRAIEICKKLGEVPKLKKIPQFDCLLIGIKKNPKELKNLIEKRLLERLKRGMVKETKKLRKEGVSWKRLEEFGLEYKWTAKFLEKKIPYSEMIERLEKDIEKFSKRQMSWFKKNPRTRWIKNYKEAEKLVKEFLA